MKIIPINNHYLVKLIEIEQKPGVLIIPNDPNKQPIYEIVEESRLGTIAIGTKVILMKYKGQEVELEGVKYVLVKDEDILAVIE